MALTGRFDFRKNAFRQTRAPLRGRRCDVFLSVAQEEHPAPVAAGESDGFGRDRDAPAHGSPGEAELSGSGAQLRRTPPSEPPPPGGPGRIDDPEPLS